MRHRFQFWLAVIVAVAALPSVAAAQAWLSDRSRTEGPGIRVGDFELHPGVGAEIGYDSNVFFEDDSPESSAILRGTAHLLFSTLGPARTEEGEARGGGSAPVQFRGGLAVAGYHFFHDRVRDNLEGDLSLDLNINPGGTFGLHLYEQFGRAIRPFTDPGAADISYARNNNVAGVELFVRSRSDILRATVGYELDYEFFDDEIFDYANNLEHRIAVKGSFRFLPQTAIINENTLEIQGYPNEADMPASLVSDNLRFSTVVGLNGAFTNTLSASIMGGYSVGFYDAADDYEAFLARVEGRWQPAPTTRFALGYDRRVRPSFVGNFFQEDRGYASLQILAAGSLLLGIEGGIAYYTSGVVLAPDAMNPLGTQLDREGVRADAELFAEYRFTDWLGVNATLRYLADFTDYTYLDPGVMDVLPDPAASYSKFEAWFGVRAFY